MPELPGRRPVHIFDAQVRAADDTPLACRVWEPCDPAEAGRPVAVLHHGVAYYGAAYGRLGAFLAQHDEPGKE